MGHWDKGAGWIEPPLEYCYGSVNFGDSFKTKKMINHSYGLKKSSVIRPRISMNLFKEINWILLVYNIIKFYVGKNSDEELKTTWVGQYGDFRIVLMLLSCKKDDISMQEKREVCISDSFGALWTQSIVSFSGKSWLDIFSCLRTIVTWNASSSD